MTDRADTPVAFDIDDAPALLEDAQILPLIEEELTVRTQVVDTGVVRLSRKVVECDELVEQPLEAVSWQVDRVPIGRVVAAHPEPRQEGDTLVYAVVEERVVVTRELILKEEVRVTRVVTTSTHRQNVTLRREELVLEHELLRDGHEA